MSGVVDWLKAIWEAVTLTPEEIRAVRIAITNKLIEVGEIIGSLDDQLLDLWEGLKAHWQKMADIEDAWYEWRNSKYAEIWDWITNFFGNLGKEFSNLWDNLSGAFTDLGNLFKERIQGLGDTISTNFNNIKTALGDFFGNIGDKLDGLPTKILDGIKGIFIPDSGYIKEKFDAFLAEVKMRFGVNTDVFRDIFQGEQPVEDVKGDYQISGVGTFNLTFLDTSFFREGVTYFRPLVRGFLVLLMVLYNIRQAIGFFGYDAGVIAGRSDWIGYNKANTGGHKE